MIFDRQELLNTFIESGLLAEYSTLEENEISNLSFNEKTICPLVESLKLLIVEVSNETSETVILNKLFSLIKKF